jgi:YHS domain-containing protein
MNCDVCKARMDSVAYTYEVGGTTYIFCSVECLNRFAAQYE